MLEYRLNRIKSRSPLMYFNRLIILPFILIFSIGAYASSFEEIVTQAKDSGFRGIIHCKAHQAEHLESVNGRFDTDTKFAIGSISKLFTQLAILQLHEKGLIKNLNDPVGGYLDPNQLPPAWRSWIYKVTILDLIKHRSGLPALLYPSEGQSSIYNHVNEAGGIVDHFFNKGNASINYTTLQANIKNADEDGEFYSNIGYNILAVIIANQSGLSYDNYLQQNIFNPAKMSNSFSGNESHFSLLNLVEETGEMAKPQVYSIDYNASIQSKSTPHIALLPRERAQVKDYNFVFTIGAGSIISTIDDLKKWVQAAFYSDALLQTSKTKKLFVDFDVEDGVWGHQGELPGFQSILLVDFANRKDTIILSNIDFDAYGFLTEVVDNAGARIDDFAQRGGIDGLEQEMEEALSQNPYLIPINIAVDLLADSKESFTPDEIGR